MKRIIICFFLIKFVFAKNYLIEVEDEAGNKEVKDREVNEPEGPHSDYSLKTEHLGLISIYYMYFLDYLPAYFKTTRDRIIDIVIRTTDTWNDQRKNATNTCHNTRNDPQDDPRDEPQDEPGDEPLRNYHLGRINQTGQIRMRLC